MSHCQFPICTLLILVVSVSGFSIRERRVPSLHSVHSCLLTLLSCVIRGTSGSTKAILKAMTEIWYRISFGSQLCCVCLLCNDCTCNVKQFSSNMGEFMDEICCDNCRFSQGRLSSVQFSSVDWVFSRFGFCRFGFGGFHWFSSVLMHPWMS